MRYHEIFMKSEAPTHPIADENEGRSAENSAPSLELVREELSRILASPGFARAERLSQLLRYLVEKTLEGRGDQIEEYLLGVEVFDRESSYDPRIDPIVRVEATRLGAKLRDYYQNQWRDDPVRIDFERGRYSPLFREGGTAEEPHAAAGL